MRDQVKASPAGGPCLWATRASKRERRFCPMVVHPSVENCDGLLAKATSFGDHELPRAASEKGFRHERRQVKGGLQEVGGRMEEAVGALSGDRDLKDAGQQDLLKGAVREAWGSVKDAGSALVDRASSELCRRGKICRGRSV